jgi:surfeit locus 1 family protein
VGDQQEDEEGDRQTHPHAERACGVSRTPLVPHHEEERRHQAADDRHECQGNDYFHPIEYRTGGRLSGRTGAGGDVRALIPSIAAALVVTLTLSLGQWQGRRADDKAAQQAERDAALAAAPVSLDAAGEPGVALEGRRVMATGVFDAAHTVFLDNRTRNGVAGFHVLTPLRLGDDARSRHVLVLRGWIARDIADRERLPPLRTPSTPVRVEGLALDELPQPIVLSAVQEQGVDGGKIWQRFELDAYRRWSGLTVLPVLVRQTSELDDGLARDWTQPGSGVDRHRGYAFQWYAMAAVTAGLWLWFVVLRRRDGTRES